MRFPFVLAVAAFALLVAATAACGGGEESNASGRATAVTGVPDGAAFVDQRNLKFHPSKLTAAVGETVYFKNSETALHTVTIDGENESGPMKGDDVFMWTAESAGEYRITCDFHPQMKATLTVEEPQT